MCAHHRHLHAFSGFEGVFGHLVCCHNWNPAFCAFAFRVLPFESVSSRPYGSFSCRFCGFQEGAFSMASYRNLRGSKGTLGPCRAVCLWRVGLESCWGSAVSDACPPPAPPCFLACLGTSSAATTGIMLSALSLFESYRLKVFPVVRTGALPADFVASKKVRFRWLPTGIWGVQRVR